MEINVIPSCRDRFMIFSNLYVQITNKINDYGKMIQKIVTLFLLFSSFLTLSANSATAGQWPMQLEGSATLRNVLFESFLRPT
jgi:hypothetical protein